ncbi:calcium uniporter protein 2, mitochondrial-like [Euphorbia lathyris]|uniref:calcium uniporter protein 2, mitochondrial-like n=1 Tax=Euphorbia lathyris TaxID=212925 RepID=UPI003313723F
MSNANPIDIPSAASAHLTDFATGIPREMVTNYSVWISIKSAFCILTSDCFWWIGRRSQPNFWNSAWINLTIATWVGIPLKELKRCLDKVDDYMLNTGWENLPNMPRDVADCTVSASVFLHQLIQKNVSGCQTQPSASSSSSLALCKLFSKRLSGSYTAVSLQHSPISSPPSLQPTVPPNAAKSNFHKEYLNSPESTERGFFRRFLHRRSINQLPKFLSMPVGEKLKERLKSITGDGIRFDGLVLSTPAKESEAIDLNHFRISVEEARKILRLSQMEKLKLKLRQIPESSIQYHEFIQICVEECGNEIEGVEFAKTLDQCGNVIVLGSIVFLRPEQVAKSIQNIITQSIVYPDD